MLGLLAPPVSRRQGCSPVPLPGSCRQQPEVHGKHRESAAPGQGMRPACSCYVAGNHTALLVPRFLGALFIRSVAGRA